jgi:hypothetical protein
MNEFEDSKLWSISDFRRARDTGQLGPRMGDDRPTLLPTTLLADLQQLYDHPTDGDVLEVIAACIRHREAALLYLQSGDRVWPVTLFPRDFLYHSPREVSTMAAESALSRLSLISAEPPGVRAPGDPMHERVASESHYHPLSPFLWAVALHGPRATLLNEISGRVAYRFAASSLKFLPPSLGALSAAITRLQQEAAPLQDIANWPGLSLQRASRLLNALYLTGALMVTQSHPAARREPINWRGLLGRRR